MPAFSFYSISFYFILQIHIIEEGYLDTFKKDDIVYLTSDSENVLEGGQRFLMSKDFRKRWLAQGLEEGYAQGLEEGKI